MTVALPSSECATSKTRRVANGETQRNIASEFNAMMAASRSPTRSRLAVAAYSRWTAGPAPETVEA